MGGLHSLWGGGVGAPLVTFTGLSRVWARGQWRKVIRGWARRGVLGRDRLGVDGCGEGYVTSIATVVSDIPFSLSGSWFSLQHVRREGVRLMTAAL